MALLGSPMTRDHFPSSLEANLRKSFYITLIKNGERFKFIEKIYNVESSRIKNERHAVNAGFGTYETRDEGGAITYDAGQEAWNANYVHREFCLGTRVTRVAVEDDLHGVVHEMMKTSGGELAEVAFYTQQRDAMDLFNTKLTSGTVYTAGGTNYALLSTTHFRVDGSTWSNRPAADMDLSIEALEFAVAHWDQNMVTQRGQKTMTSPELLMTGSNDWALSRRLLKSVGRPQSADNDPNVINDILKDQFANKLMTNDGRWLLFGPKEDRGLTFYNRVKPDVERVADDSNLNMQVIGRYRASWGATHVSQIWGSP